MLASGFCQASLLLGMQYQFKQGAREEKPWGACVCPRVRMEGQGDASWITQSCLPWCCGLSMANSHLESISLPNEPPECCMFNKIYLSISAFMRGARSPGRRSQYATSAWNNPLGSCLFFTPACERLQDQALRGWNEWLPD